MRLFITSPNKQVYFGETVVETIAHPKYIESMKDVPSQLNGSDENLEVA